MIVALSGYYGYANTGDEAILLAITTELKRLGHVPLVLSNTPAETSRLYSVNAVHRMRPLEVWNALGRADVLFSGGGGLLQDKTSARTLQYYLGLIRLAKFRKKKAVIFNQSIGPLSSAGEKAVTGALKDVKAIVRESSSQAYLQKLGVKTLLGGDPALLLEPVSLKLKVKADLNTVILAPRGGQPGATARLVELGMGLAQAGRKVIAFSFQPGVDTAELETMKLIPGIRLEETADPKRAVELIANTGAVVGVRLHAVILAAASGIPFYGVSYDPKVANFCLDAGAVSVSTDFDVQALLKNVLERRAPNWDAIKAMRDRARESFKIALR